MAKCTVCKKKREESELRPSEFGLACDECIAVMRKYTKKGTAIVKEKEDKPISTLKPIELKNKLDESIIGQHSAKITLSVEISNHLKRVTNPALNFRKSNIFLVGPTGTGKTLMLETLASLIHVPLSISDATTFTEAGYAGKDVTACLCQLLEKCNYDVSLAEKGIIYIDEADKMVVRKSDGKNSRDIRGESVQQAFLKIIEGADIEIEVPTEIASSGHVTLNTKNILFIFGGAFDGIDRIIEERIHKGAKRPLIEVHHHQIKTQFDNSQVVEISDIIRFGFIKEFVGRIPLVVTLHRLSTEQLMSVLVETNFSIINEYKNMFEADGITIDFDKDALHYIVEEACKHDTGARSIRGIMSKWLNPLLFDISQGDTQEFVVTKDVLKYYNGRI